MSGFWTDDDLLDPQLVERWRAERNRIEAAREWLLALQPGGPDGTWWLTPLEEREGGQSE